MFFFVMSSAAAFVQSPHLLHRQSSTAFTSSSSEPQPTTTHDYVLRSNRSPFDVHVYFSSDDERAHALTMREKMQARFPWMRYYGPKDRPIGPHPVPMWEADFAKWEHRDRWGAVVAFVEAERGPCSVLIHPYSTDGDYKDHTTNAYWAGPPLQLRIRSEKKDPSEVALPAPSAELIEAAARPLLRETLERQAQKPVLDLSLRREAMDGDDDDDDDDDVKMNRDRSWETGHRWEETRGRLAREFPEIDGEAAKALLSEVPQLLRLDPQQVLDAAAEAIAMVGSADAVLKEAPTLLGVRAEDVREGEKHLATMMAMPAALVRSAIQMEPKLLAASVEARLRERATVAALNAASSATSNALGRVVGDAAATARQRRELGKK